ncbi:endonuclease YncB(thermonuclease family) [Sulfitobacter undariae]|uniref:Endonuclease YncB(Thermonuclease family) n=1 Tax=Sulfitobacter undariae TaxID=1563671 RepID=A0A7W6H187_9RHOB|nr:thermonuclease family protein [Sulfitobacter undariae]MBB3993499.1 endonuclease YncB(thermonuclease family) [Sulfitobacter undariae]
MKAEPFSSLVRHWRFAVLLGCTALAFALFGGGLQANLSPQEFSGKLRVIDGDTFEVGGVKVRLHAVDAPESDQTCETNQDKDWACGGWVTKVVSDRYEGASAQCQQMDIDRYGRVVARCTALGEDIGGWLVSEGFAFAYVQYGADYVEIEREAAANDRGLHAVKMQTPAAHRKARRTQPVQTNGTCNIKGNISAKGVKIYHVPGQYYYSRTRINERKGERWFCTEASARAAGWRKARR